MSRNPANNDYPHDRLTQRVLRDLRQPGYYADFSTLAQQKFWDAKTREVILGRVNNIPVIRFFTAAEAGFLELICDHVIPQADRDAAHKIPIVPWIDERLYENRHDGYRFADMPPDPEAFRLGLEAIEQIANHSYGRSYIALERLEQDKILKSLHDGAPPAGSEIWKRMPVHRFWMMLAQYCIEVYYAHPWAWDEIGFGGPAYRCGRASRSLPVNANGKRAQRPYLGFLCDETTKGETNRSCGTKAFLYRATMVRRVVAKVEFHRGGLFPRGVHRDQSWDFKPGRDALLQ